MADNILELCPFCGGIAEGELRIISPSTWIVECCGCGVMMFGKTRGEVIEKWNSRIYNSA